MIRHLALIIVSASLLQGCCSSSCDDAKACTSKTLTVHVTADQQFVFNGKTQTVEEFFETADYVEGSNNVILDVDQNSVVAETTIVRAIDLLKGHGYVVSMAADSK